MLYIPGVCVLVLGSSESGGTKSHNHGPTVSWGYFCCCLWNPCLENHSMFFGHDSNTKNYLLFMTTKIFQLRNFPDLRYYGNNNNTVMLYIPGVCVLVLGSSESGGTKSHNHGPTVSWGYFCCCLWNPCLENHSMFFGHVPGLWRQGRTGGEQR